MFGENGITLVIGRGSRIPALFAMFFIDRANLVWSSKSCLSRSFDVGWALFAHPPKRTLPVKANPNASLLVTIFITSKGRTKLYLKLFLLHHLRRVDDDNIHCRVLLQNAFPERLQEILRWAENVLEIAVVEFSIIRGERGKCP